MSISDHIYRFYHSNWQTNVGYVIVDVVNDSNDDGDDAVTTHVIEIPQA